MKLNIDKALPPPTPFVKWAGGKRQLLPHLLNKLPPTLEGAYYEPFVGGGALFFSLAPQVQFDRVNGEPVSLIIGDSNAALIATYEALRDVPAEVITHLKERENTEEKYYEVRKRNFQVGTLAERAADFIFCNKAGFNGLYRVNKSGQSNVPWGHNPKATICDEQNLWSVHRYLQNVVLREEDFEGTTSDAEKGDTVYFDPPYVPASATANFTAYDKAGFGPAEQTRLRDHALKLTRQGVRVILTNSDTPLVRELYAGWRLERVEARRAINSKGDGRGAVGELIITA